MNNFKILFIKKNDDDYIVFSKNKQYNGKYYPPSNYNKFEHALNLCRLRLNKTLQNDVTILKIPFLKYWLIF